MRRNLCAFRVLSEVSQKKKRGEKASESCDGEWNSSIEKSAFIISSQRGGQGASRGRGGGCRGGFSGDSKDKLKCEHCGRSKHTKDTCWDSYGRPQEFHNCPPH